MVYHFYVRPCFYKIFNFYELKNYNLNWNYEKHFMKICFRQSNSSLVGRIRWISLETWMCSSKVSGLVHLTFWPIFINFHIEYSLYDYNAFQERKINQILSSNNKNNQKITNYSYINYISTFIILFNSKLTSQLVNIELGIQPAINLCRYQLQMDLQDVYFLLLQI